MKNTNSPLRSDNYLVTKFRDGHHTPELKSYIFADDYESAKAQFTKNIRWDMVEDSNYSYIDDWQLAEMRADNANNPNDTVSDWLDNLDYEGAGYYDQNGNAALLDSEIVDTFREDVYTWRVEDHQYKCQLYKLLNGELTGDDPYLEILVPDESEAEELARRYAPAFDCDAFRVIVTRISDSSEVYVFDFEC